jgi:ribosome maturation factor RimP
MAKKDEYVSRTEAIATKEAALLGLEIVDVEYVKEGSNYYLRIYADKDGGITVDDCEALSRKVEAVLDEEDFISDAYILEVSSPGLTRPLKKDKDFERNLEEVLEIKTYKPIDGEKEMVAKLIAYDDKTITVSKSWDEDDKDEIIIDRDNLALVRLYINF